VTEPLVRRLVAELLGAGLLTATVVGSGVMAETLAGGNVAVALFANTAATVAVLFVLIKLFGPVSGAHFNPAVTLVLAQRRAISFGDACGYVVVQVVGCCLGAWLAHVMFALPIIETSQHARSGAPQFVSELVATFGLLLVVLGHARSKDAAAMVAAWIGAAYWFTASTSFANPAITIARSLTDTFAGIRPQDVPAFIVAELIGAALAAFVASMLFPPQHPVRDG
jgi:glycerol uptake facilitator-like aquaporin